MLDYSAKILQQINRRKPPFQRQRSPWLSTGFLLIAQFGFRFIENDSRCKCESINGKYQSYWNL